MKKLIFDIETKTALFDPETPTLLDMEISVISMHDSETDRYYSFQEEQFNEMWSFFEEADMFITFNGNYFDIPLLQKYAPFDLNTTYHLDVFAKVEKSIKKKIGLDAIASTTLGTSKSANGLQAVAWWNSGEIDKIIKYCEQDVKVTKDVYEYALKNNKLYYIDRKTQEKTEIPLNTSFWEKEKKGEPKTLTLF
ncbi:MAG: ribonuclease H-like domain-containing protein [Candidatus Pacebacteria bacterium]|nr:ribonuclease H-like domain-containing protein [Candidatus Paceibacterota bacterium]